MIDYETPYTLSKFFKIPHKILAKKLECLFNKNLIDRKLGPKGAYYYHLDTCLKYEQELKS